MIYVVIFLVCFLAGSFAAGMIALLARRGRGRRK